MLLYYLVEGVAFFVIVCKHLVCSLELVSWNLLRLLENLGFMAESSGECSAIAPFMKRILLLIIDIVSILILVDMNLPLKLDNLGDILVPNFPIFIAHLIKMILHPTNFLSNNHKFKFNLLILSDKFILINC